MNYYIEFLLVIFLHIHCNHVSGEYYIGSNDVTRYLYHKFDRLEDEIFPRNIRINVSLSSIAGILLCSIDRNMNQLIVSLQDTSGPTMVIEFRGGKESISITDLCQCTLCQYEILDLWIQIMSRIQIQCNSHIIKYIEYRVSKDFNKDYPHSMKDLNMLGQNEAHMFLINHFKYEGIYPSSKQLSGCLFSVQYNDVTVSFTNMSNIIEGICKETCIRSLCNGGECYDHSPVCNCTKTFRNGPNCNNTMLSKNFQTKNYNFYCHSIKLSWKSVNKELFKLSNQYVQILLETNENNVYMLLNYSNGIPVVTKATLSKTYIPNTESILIAQFNDRFVNIQFYNNGNWSNGKIPTNLTDITYESMKMTSGTGVMDMVFMSNGERFHWKILNSSLFVDIQKLDKKLDIVPNIRNNESSLNTSSSSSFVGIQKLDKKLDIVPNIPNNESSSTTSANCSFVDIQKLDKKLDSGYMIPSLIILVILLVIHIGLLIIFRHDIWKRMICSKKSNSGRDGDLEMQDTSRRANTPGNEQTENPPAGEGENLEMQERITLLDHPINSDSDKTAKDKDVESDLTTSTKYAPTSSVTSRSDRARVRRPYMDQEYSMPYMDQEPSNDSQV